jgi:hypothetical protein
MSLRNLGRLHPIRRHMYYSCRIRLVCLLVTMLLLALPAAAQEEVGYVDLTGMGANPLRYEKFIPDSSCNGMFGGGWGTAIGCPARTYPFELLLLSVDTDKLSEDSEAFVLLRLQNVGHEAASVPWITDPDQIELPDANGKFSFAGADLRANVAQDGGTTRFAIPVRLYGAKAVPGTLKEIRPGDYVELQIGVALDCKAALLGCQSLKSGQGKLSINWTESDNQVTYEKCSTHGGDSRTRELTSNSVLMTVVRSAGSH